MNMIYLLRSLERLATLSEEQQAFVIQFGCIVVAVVALAVALKALNRRVR